MDRLTEDAINMLEVMERTADRADIWQDRCVYAMAKAIYHIILRMHAREMKNEEADKRQITWSEYGYGNGVNIDSDTADADKE